MDISLSLTITSICFLIFPALLRASKASPPDKAPSPIMLTTLKFSFSKFLLTAIPSAAEIEVDA